MSESPAGLFRGLFETHVQVKDLEEAMRFYGDVLGLELGLRETERRVAFYWIGWKGRTVIGLWEKPPWVPFDTGNLILPQHLAFEVNLDDLATAIERVKRRGIELRNFLGQITDEPSVFGWVPGASIYFNDVDGHLLEFMAKLDAEPQKDIGIVSLTEWNRLQGAVKLRARYQPS